MEIKIRYMVLFILGVFLGKVVIADPLLEKNDRERNALANEVIVTSIGKGP